MKVFLRKIRIALTPRQWFLKTRLSNGAVVYGKNRAGFGGRGIYVFRDAIEPEFQSLEKFLDPDGVFVDVGANTGIYTIKAAKHFCNKGVVLSLEPFPETFAVLFRNVQANHFTNVRLRNLCAGEHTRTDSLWLNSGRPTSFSLVKNQETTTSFSTLTVALDDLVAWERLERIDYLKIDVEGAEQQIISGARKAIEKYRPIIQLETSIKDFVLDLVGYSVFRAPRSQNKVCIPKESTKIQIPATLGWAQMT